MIVDGFNIDEALVCEGVVGDGCGGGRTFYIKDETLYAYDSYTKTNRKLLENLVNVISISKSACIISIKFQNRSIDFDLSSLK